MRLLPCLLVISLGLAVLRAEEEPKALPTWTEMMAKGIVPYHQLTVDDFRVNDQAHPKDGFYIQPSISPQYHFILKSYNGFIFAAVDQWVIMSGLN